MGKLNCNKCGHKMTVSNEGVFVFGAGGARVSPDKSPIVKLRCERCNITRMEQRADIEKEQGRGCFIATACYGSYEHPVVKEFCWFRDSTLMRTK